MKNWILYKYSIMKIKRPKAVTWLAIGVLILAILYLIRFVEVVQTWDYLQSLPISVSPLYLGLTGLVWAVTWLATFFGLWRGQNWASSNLQIFSVLFAIYYWVDQALLGTDPNRMASYPFKIFATLAIITVIYWVLSRPQTRLYFGELDE